MCLILLCGCEKYHVSVRQLHVDPTYLASMHVGTPDPRKAHPPIGQKLIIDWTVPPEMLAQDPKLVMYLIYKNHTEKEVSYPILYRNGTHVYSLLNEEFEQTKGLLTYRAEIVVDGKVYKDWKHQLWVNLITLEEERTASAASTSDSVISQSMQGSVIDTAYLSEDGFSGKN
jgi:hypothetical protein